jgi:hypothetical protein
MTKLTFEMYLRFESKQKKPIRLILHFKQETIQEINPLWLFGMM